MSQRLVVVFEDEHCLAMVKPAGQFTQGSWAPPGEQTLEQSVRDYLNPCDPASVYLGIVHRLDRPVSGLMLWTKNPKAARRLSAQFERRQVEKEYWAIVEGPRALTLQAHSGTGTPGWRSEGTWTDWLTSPGVVGKAAVVEPGTDN